MEAAQPGKFAELLDRIRAEEEAALQEFVTTYEPYLRRTIRYRINREGLQAAFDSNDVCQSVLGVFLIRLLAGDYVIDSHESLCKLLMAIMNNKFLMAQRREYAAKRDRRRTLPLNAEQFTDARQETPSEIISHIELIKRFRASLTLDELELYELRQRGQSWEQIGEQLQEKPVALRKKLSRAANRVALDLGFEDDKAADSD